MNRQADAAIAAVTQEAYAKRLAYYLDIAPVTADDYLKRWLFAYATIHSSWRQSVTLYRMLADLGWLDSQAELKRRLVASRVGFQNTRTEYLWDFAKAFRENPATFQPAPGETWPAFRDRLVATARGIGITKVSFVLELAWPLECRVVCLDRHMLRLYGMPTDKLPKPRLYREAETHWLESTTARGLAPAIARAAYWDGVQQQTEIDYWGRVFHERCAVT